MKVTNKATKDNFDFSGYATKANLLCTDGRTIMPDAFKHNDGVYVPLVWQHLINEPGNILGHALLENRPDGVYLYGKFNGTDNGTNAKKSVLHGDIQYMSIRANSLVEKAKQILHGTIREVSLVISGANPGAAIDNISFAHSDGDEYLDETEAIITSGELIHFEEAKEDKEEITHDSSEEDNDGVNHSEDEGDLQHSEDVTLQSIYDSMSKDQKDVLHFMIAAALENNDIKHSDEEGEEDMKKNLFEDDDKGRTTVELTHADMEAITAHARRNGSLKEAMLTHLENSGEAEATELLHSITNVDFLFPDNQTVGDTPQLYGRRMEWVNKVFGAARKSPFSRIKTVVADMTPDAARAKGYVTGDVKVDQVLALLKRVTNPTTVYKKQAMDRDDVVDITDMDVVMWIKAELRVMLEEEIARAMLVGDGRSPAASDKIDPTAIRPMFTDDTLYAFEVQSALTDSVSDVIDSVVTARATYQGSGNPVFYGTPAIISQMLLLKDSTGRRLYANKNDLASALLVSDVVEVPVIENIVSDINGVTGAQLHGIVVNMSDYVLGADKGGAVSMFDDFDIDYNKLKYLIETRVSGALTRPKSAIIVTQVINTP